MKIKALLVLLLTFMPLCAFADEASHRAAAHELLTISKPEQVMEQVWVQVEQSVNQQFQEMGAPEELKPVFDDYSEKMFRILQEALSFEKMKDELIAIYVKTYTEEEIRSIIQFYKTPVGRKFIEKTPQLMEKTMELTERNMQGSVHKIQALTKELQLEIERRYDS